MKRVFERLALALALVGLVAEPASAIAYGGWNGRLSLDSWYDDNLTRGLTVSPAALPYGNQELGLNLGASLGNVFVLTPEIDSWLIASVHGRVGVLYPSLSGAWGSLFSNTIWHLEGGREAYLLLGATHFFNSGTYNAAGAGLVQPLWAGGSARAEAGVGGYRADVASSSFTMPSIGGGLDQAFMTGTVLGARYAYQTLFYTTAQVAPRHQLYLFATQRLGPNWELHARYLRTLDLSATAPYQEGYWDAGVGYDF